MESISMNHHSLELGCRPKTILAGTFAAAEALPRWMIFEPKTVGGRQVLLLRPSPLPFGLGSAGLFAQFFPQLVHLRSQLEIFPRLIAPLDE